MISAADIEKNKKRADLGITYDEALVCNASVMDMMRNEIQAKNFEGIEKEYSEVMESIFSGLLDQSIIQAYGDVLYFQLLNKKLF